MNIAAVISAERAGRQHLIGVLSAA